MPAPIAANARSSTPCRWTKPIGDRSDNSVLLASVGIAMVGVAYGMARYGYGLLLPDIRASYGLSSAELGLIAASAYLSYLAASGVAAAQTTRLGPRAVVLAGGACATVGMLLAGLSRSPALLVAGLLIGGASAGLVFPPFSDLVAVRTPGRLRGRVLAAISSGTGWGVAIAAPVAILAGTQWRSAWLAFASIALVSTLWAWRVLPPGVVGAGGQQPPRLRWSWFICSRSAPLLAGAFLVGLASSVYWTFAVDLLTGAGALSSAQGRAFLVAVGVASVLAIVGGDLVRWMGAGLTFGASIVATALALALLGAAPGSPGLAAVSALLFGLGYCVAVSVQVIWSAGVFESRPSAGLAVVMFAANTGFLIGPPIAGLLADLYGLRVAFAAGAAILAATALLAPRGDSAGARLPTPARAAMDG